MPSRLVNKGGMEWDLVRKAGGGLNERADVYDIPDGECSELINFVFKPGAWEKRKGVTKKLQLPSGEINSLIVANFLSENVLLICKNDLIYAVDYTDDEWEYTLLTVNQTLTSGQRFDHAQFEDVLYLVNGANRPMKWRGGSNNVEQIGISPASDGVASFGGSGSCTAGAHGVRICWRNNDAGTISAYKDLGTVSSSGSDVLSIGSLTDSTDDQVTHLEIYMTIAGGSTYYLAAQVAIAGTYEADISDATLQTQATMDSVADQGLAGLPPEKCKYIAPMKKRLFFGYNYRSGAWRKDEIAWTETVGTQVTEPEYVGSTSYRKVPTRGGAITRVVPWGDFIYILHENGIVVLTDPSNPDFSVMQELVQVTGCTAPWSVQVGKFKKRVPAPPELHTEEFELVEGIIYKGKWGVVGFDGVRDHVLSEKVESTVRSIAPASEEESVGFFNDGKYYLAFGNRYGASGDEQRTSEDTTTSGGERINAQYSTDRAFDSYDAVNYLSQTSKADSEIKVGVRIPFNTMTAKIGYTAVFNVTFDIYASMDSGVTWDKIQTQTVSNRAAVNSFELAQENYEYSFVKPGVTAVRLDFVNRSSSTVDGEEIDSIQLRYVDYAFDPSATIVNTSLLYYDSFYNTWSRFRGWHAGSFVHLFRTGDETAAYFGHSSNGAIYRMHVGHSDDGDDIFALVTTGYTDGKSPEVKKRWLRNRLVLNFGNDPIYYLAYVDKLEAQNRTIERTMDGERESFYDEVDYGDDYYGQADGEKQVGVNLEPNAGYRMAEEIWVSGKEGLLIRGRVASFVKREL